MGIGIGDSTFSPSFTMGCMAISVGPEPPALFSLAIGCGFSAYLIDHELAQESAPLLKELMIVDCFVLVV